MCKLDEVFMAWHVDPIQDNRARKMFIVLCGLHKVPYASENLAKSKMG